MVGLHGDYFGKFAKPVASLLAGQAPDQVEVYGGNVRHTCRLVCGYGFASRMRAAQGG
jgi:hypothetical protein